MHRARHHRAAVLVCAVIALTICRPAQGSTWTIHADGSGDLATIQDAIDHAASGDTIDVTPGRYAAHLWIESKSVVLRSTDGPETTILTGEGQRDAGPVVHFFYELGTGSVIEGFTIEEGETGIHCTSASPVIRNNIIRRNQSALGAGICCIFDSRPQILSNRIIDNRTSYHCCFPSRGGGIYSDDTSPVVVRGNLIAGNRCDGECIGGGISCFVGEIEGNTIVANSAHGPAGGVELPYLGVTFLRNIVAWNSSSEFGDGIVVFRSADLFCNDVWSNGEEDYWGVEPGYGDFSEDPRFCGYPGSHGAPAARFDPSDFALLPDSPCIPGNHPSGIDCGEIGAYREGCGRGTMEVAGTPAPPPQLEIIPNPTHGPALIRIGPMIPPGATVEIFDGSGRRVASLHPESSGSAHWNGRSDTGGPVPAGIYFARPSPGPSPAGSILVIR